MNVILFDDWHRYHLLPLTFTRSAADMRIGILTIREKWEKVLHCSASILTEEYLQAKYPLHFENDNLFISSSLLPNPAIIEAISGLSLGTALYHQNELLAFRTTALQDSRDFYQTHLLQKGMLPLGKCEYDSDCQILIRPFHLFKYNESAIAYDFKLLTAGRKSQPIGNSNVVIGDSQRIFVEEGAVVTNATLNAQDGYIYIGKDAEIMEGCRIRGSVALCEHATLKMDAKIYGATTIGPHSKVGGELSNVIIFGYSNKAHDGFLGNSVIGEWCNLGADTNSSNLKNNYSSVRLWNYATCTMEESDEQFCGVIMGDYSKCGICTMFNTGTVVGVSTCLYGGGFHPKHIPSFSFGSPTDGYVQYQLDKVFTTARIVAQRRHKIFDSIEQNILKKVYDITIQTS